LEKKHHNKAADQLKKDDYISFIMEHKQTLYEYSETELAER